MVVFRVDTVFVLGVSAGPFMFLMRMLCDLLGKKIVVNIDGVEWRRSKYSRLKKAILRSFDFIAQKSAHIIIYDNPALYEYVLKDCRPKSLYVAYPADNNIRIGGLSQDMDMALTICRVEPENNLDMMIEGFLKSSLGRYYIVGNWENSDYSKSLYQRYKGNPRLMLVGPEYEKSIISLYRERCAFYLHGHSVGGTNPSLVEMLYYDCTILCYDCAFNRYTAQSRAYYFTSEDSLADLLNGPKQAVVSAMNIVDLEIYKSEYIAARYIGITR